MGQTSEELLLKITGDSTGGQRSVVDIRTELKAAQKDVEDIQKAFAGVGPGGNGGKVFQEQLDAAKTKVAALSQELEAAKKPAEDTTKTWKEMASAFTSAGTAMHSTGAILTAAVTAPLVGAGLAGEHFAADFQTQMTRVQTLAGASAKEVAAMRGEILALAPAVGIGPAELAKGLFVLESAGQRGKAALDTLTIAGKMSAIGMGETEAVARSLIGVMLSYQQQNLSAAEAGDILVKTVQLGNMKIDELVPALARVNPLAAAMGVKFQDVAAAIATFTHMGASTEVAATGLRAILSNILNDSAKTEKGFALLSQTLGDTSISMHNFRQEIAEKGLATALIDLMEKANAAGEKGMESLNKIFPNIKALTEVLANAKANGTMYMAITEDMYKANGTLNASFGETTKTWAYQWDLMKAKAEVMWVTLGDQLLPVFSKVVRFVSDDVVPAFTSAANAFGALPDSVKLAAIGLGGFVAAAGPALYILGSLAGAVGNLIKLWEVLGETTVVVRGLGLLSGAMTAVQGSAIALGLGLGALTTGAIAGAITAVYALKLAWDNHAQSVRTGAEEQDRSARTIAAAMEIVKGPVKDEAEALAILNARAKELRDAHAGVKAATDDSAKSHLVGAAAAKTLADQVHALTEEQKADILSKREQHESIKAIAKETGLATDVVSMFLAQQKDGAKETKAWTEAMREYNALGIDYHDTIAMMGAATVEGIKYDLARGAQQQLLQKIYGVTAEQIRAITLAEKEDEKQLQETIKNIEYFRGMGEKAAADIGKSLGGQRTVLTNLMFATNAPEDLPPFAGKQVSNTSLMPLGPDLSWLAKKNMDSYRFTLTDGMSTLFKKELPNVILGAIQGGGDVTASIGSAFGGQLGSNIGKKLTGALTSHLGETLGPAIGGLLGPLGALAGQLIGPAIDGLKHLFGGVSEEEKKARESVASFEAQIKSTLSTQQLAEAGGQSWKQTVIGIRDAFIATGHSEAEAEAAAKSLWDSSRSGAAATKAAIDAVAAVMNEQKQDQADLTAAVQRYGFTVDQLGPTMRKQQLDDQAKQLLNDWRLLVASGMDLTVVNLKMASSVQDYLNRAKLAGQEVPIAMQPIIQKMIEQGDLTDENGTKITDMKDLGVTFSETMTAGFDKVVAKLDQLLQKIGMIPAAAAAAASSIPDNPFGGWQVPAMPEGFGIPDVQPMAEGGIGHITKPTWFLAGEKPGGEDVAFSGVGKRFDFSKMGAGGGVVIHAPVTVEGNVMTEHDLFEAMGQHFADTYLQTGGTLPLNR